jgi:endonuclease G
MSKQKKQSHQINKVVMAILFGVMLYGLLEFSKHKQDPYPKTTVQTEDTTSATVGEPVLGKETATAKKGEKAPKGKQKNDGPTEKSPGAKPENPANPVPKANKPAPAPAGGNTTTTANGDLRFADYLPSAYLGKQVVRHTYYTLSYAEAYEQAEWVAYELTKSRVLGNHEERDDDFRSDPLVRSGSADPDDYKRSGYDRGHLAPAADMAFNSTAMSESFFMSNMSPQEPGFNRGIWKELEELVRDFAVGCGHLYVVTGPILKNNTNGSVGRRNKIAVPNSYYKVLLDVTGKEHKGIAFVLPNASSSRSLGSYAVTIDEVERLTGIDFFPALPEADAARLEGQANFYKWGRSND